MEISYQELQPLVVLLALLSGAALGQFWRARWIRRNRARLRREAKQILIEAERTGKGTIIDAELEAKRILLDQRQIFDLEAAQLRQELLKREELLNQRLEGVSEMQSDLETRSAALNAERQALEQRTQELLNREKELRQRLEQVAGESASQAREQLFAQLSSEVEIAVKHQAAREIEICRQNVEEVSRELISTCVERLARAESAERSTSLVALEDETVKGRIIGRDGRNVRAFEAIAGVEIILDEIPHYAVLSSHDAERRETARVALVNLIKDGRIQPARIEEFVARAKAECADNLLNAGREAALSVGINDLKNPVLAVLGRLRLRSSLGQNVLMHSVECARLACFAAAELSLGKELSMCLIRSSLLHDIGKALGPEFAGPHALTGAQFLKTHGEDNLVCNLVASHHNQVADQSMLCALLRAIDTLSGARPGARREDYQNYLKRLEQLEKLALNFEGVSRAYALQAGRELHISVESDKVSDDELPVLAAQIARRIETEFRSLGLVKVSITRQSQVVEFARWEENAVQRSLTEIP